MRLWIIFLLVIIPDCFLSILLGFIVLANLQFCRIILLWIFKIFFFWTSEKLRLPCWLATLLIILVSEKLRLIIFRQKIYLFSYFINWTGFQVFII